MAHDDEYQPFPDIGERNLIQEFVEIPLLDLVLRLPHNAAVLEIGCGRGIGLAALAKRIAPQRLTGVDIDAELLTLAGQDLATSGHEVELLRADARALPLRTNSFDVVVSFGTLFHIARPEAAVAEIERVTRPGGQFVNETRVAQLLAHPVRSRRGGLRASDIDVLGPASPRLLWASHRVT